MFYKKCVTQNMLLFSETGFLLQVLVYTTCPFLLITHVSDFLITHVMIHMCYKIVSLYCQLCCNNQYTTLPRSQGGSLFTYKGVAIFNPLISEMYPKCIQKYCCFWRVYGQKTGLKRMIFGTRLQGGNFMSNPLVSELTYPLISENATPFWMRLCSNILLIFLLYIFKLSILKLVY